jgi:hypothetical protein
MSATIRCRAKLGDVECMDGQLMTFVNEDNELEAIEPSDDGTYESESGTIVCDACYVALMPFTLSQRALNEELDEAIGVYRLQLNHVREQDDDVLLLLRKQAAEQATGARMGSPRWASARACAQMAQREIDRRAS